MFRALSCRSGLFSFRRRILSLAVSLPGLFNGIRSLVGFGKPVSPLAHSVLYPRGTTPNAAPKCISGRTSYLCVRLAFHRTNHSSSRDFSTSMSSGLHGVLPPLHPDHG